MPTLTDTDLYVRGTATMLDAWQACADGSDGAAIVRGPGVATGVFPRGPEREIYNNALLARDLDRVDAMIAIDAMEDAYAAAGITQYAAWVHEAETAARDEIEARGYTINETERAMGMALSDLRAPRPDLDLAPSVWDEHVRYLGGYDGVPEGLLAGVAPDAFHVVTVRDGAERIATGIARDRDGDCGIYNVSTVERMRRRGLGTAVTALLAHDGLDRGCVTASLQSTPMAERVYAGLGFRDLGLYFEYVPAG